MRGIYASMQGSHHGTGPLPQTMTRKQVTQRTWRWTPAVPPDSHGEGDRDGYC